MEAELGDTPKSKSLVQTSLRRYVTCHSKNRAIFTKEDTATTSTPKSRFRGASRSNLIAFSIEKFSCYEDVCESPLSRRKPPSFMAMTARRSSSSAFALQERNLNQQHSNMPRERKRPADLYLQNKFSEADTENGTSSPFDSKRRKTALFFDHEYKDIPVAARSLQRVHSLSALEKTPNSPDYIAHYSLKTVERPHCDAHNAFGCISGETLCQLLFSFPAERFSDRFFLVDCRYPYEYNGGHIKNAVNIYDIEDVARVFYPSDPAEFYEINSKIPIFYCEFSQQRGPQMAKELRKLDRERNLHSYPNVDYKEIYVVDQGYRKFFREFPSEEFCEPIGYVPMIHASYVDELKKFRFHHEKRRTLRAPKRQTPLQEVDIEEDDILFD